REKIGAKWKEKGRKGKFTVTVYAAKPDKQGNRDFLNAGADRIMHTAPSEDEAKTRDLLQKWKAELL
ncbi:MAG TPA: hypothetical protein VL359_02745, partial [bacterium]|nr:hypothetical protein [bacterium]